MKHSRYHLKNIPSDDTYRERVSQTDQLCRSREPRTGIIKQTRHRLMGLGRVVHGSFKTRQDNKSRRTEKFIYAYKFCFAESIKRGPYARPI
jgi:hypothetical protein